MKKTTTAAIAATVGAVLLLGGAGTLAYWSDTDSTTSQVINSGKLDLGTVGNDWKLQQTAQGKSTASIAFSATTPIVPGDVVTNTATVPVVLQGTNNKATLKVEAPALTGALAGLPVTVLIDGVATTTADFTTTANPKVTIKVTFPFGDSADALDDVTELKTATVTAKYTLTQVAAGTTVTP
ncbi:alternate-type signal peptide domain-containing protein [Mycetocola zhadangensis]|nr:alternate-type signal peptide domain-containing protein [Mycetocola zhadangensis]